MKKLNLNKNQIIIGITGIIILAFIAMFAMGFFKSTPEAEMGQEQKDAVVCFMDKNPEDAVDTETKDGVMINYEVVKLEFINNTDQIKGVYNVVPFASEATRGEFTGILENQIFKTDYTYIDEGEEKTKKQEFKLGSGGLLVGEIIGEEEEVTIEFQKFLQKVNCSDTEFQQNIKTFSL